MTPVAPGLGPGVRTIIPPPLTLTRAQVEKKYDQHAAAFGVTAPRGREGFAQLDAAIRAFVASPDTLHIDGTYRSQPTIIHVDTRRHLVCCRCRAGSSSAGGSSPHQERNVLEEGNSVTDRRPISARYVALLDEFVASDVSRRAVRPGIPAPVPGRATGCSGDPWYPVLNDLFYACEDYVIQPELRTEPGDLDEAQLLDAARTARARLAALGV